MVQSSWDPDEVEVKGKGVVRGKRRRHSQRAAEFLQPIRSDGEALPLRVRRCSTFLCRLRGLMFRTHLPEDEGLLFLLDSEGRLEAAIHMFFVFFPIGVVWLRQGFEVVDTVVAQPFRPMYVPRAPAIAFLEGPPALVEWLRAGDHVTFQPWQGR